MAAQKRSPSEIVAQIIEACLHGQRKTQIMYEVHMDFRTLDKYLKYLVEKGLLQKDRQTYKATERGKQYVESYRAAQSILQN